MLYVYDPPWTRNAGYLIVTGTHSRHTIGRLLLGSVAQKILRRAPCPILTVNDKAPRVDSYETDTGRAAALIAGI
jgi:hypothetical protein